MTAFMLSGIADECADGLDNQIRTHRQLGWQWIEIRNVDRKVIDNIEEQEFKTIRNKLALAGMKASCLASDIGKLTLVKDGAKTFDRDVKALDRLLQYAEKLECGFIRVMAYKQGDLSDLGWRDEAVARLKILSSMAQKTNVCLALENCVGWHAKSGKHMAGLMDRVGSDSLICLYDTANAAQEAWNYYQAVRERIKYIHVKDTAGKQRFTYPDEGISEVSRVLEDQYKLGYRGFVSIEPHMSKSAHKPDLDGDAESSNRIYLEYGERLNRIVEKITIPE